MDESSPPDPGIPENAGQRRWVNPLILGVYAVVCIALTVAMVLA